MNVDVALIIPMPGPWGIGSDGNFKSASGGGGGGFAVVVDFVVVAMVKL